MLYVELRRHLGEVFRRLAEQKEVGIKEGYPRVMAGQARCYRRRNRDLV
jgi:hypothetical protein